MTGSQAWQFRDGEVAVQMHECLRGADSGFASAKTRHDFVVLLPDALAVLAHMRAERVLLLFQHAGDIDVGIWQKALGLAAGVDLKEVEMEALRLAHL